MKRVSSKNTLTGNRNTNIIRHHARPTNSTNMKDFFEGSVSTIGDSEWTEPHDVTAMTHELAAIEVLASHAECHAVELHQEVDVCVRQVNVEGDPLSEWKYFRGSYRKELEGTLV
jgi:hypothetical protein